MGSAQHARRLAASGADIGPMLDAIVDQSERAAGVVRSLRGFIHKRPPELAPVSLEDVVADALRLLRQELGARGVVVDVDDRRGRRVPVRGDAVQLQQVLVNLLLNAADAMQALPPGQRPVRLLLDEAPDGRVRLHVADVGHGMPPDVAARVFDPFFTTKADGLGLGLSLSRTIVEAHGGRLSVAHAPGQPTTFTVDLPVESP
jgi:C4-dicarboxylate-specific signal transduction histidine kinase